MYHEYNFLMCNIAHTLSPIECTIVYLMLLKTMARDTLQLGKWTLQKLKVAKWEVWPYIGGLPLGSSRCPKPKPDKQGGTEIQNHP